MTACGRRSERGVTLVELMVTLLVSSLAVGFTFRIYGQSSLTYRSQMRVSELQQTLRTAKDMLVRDLRQAGALAANLHLGASGVDLIYPAVTVDNDADRTGPDKLRLLGADLSCLAGVTGPGNSTASGSTSSAAWNSGETRVSSSVCFAVNDTAALVRRADPGKGTSCVMKITGKTTGRFDRLEHAAGAVPWNLSANAQCLSVSTSSPYDGNTVAVKFAARTYRIKPNDRRGVLQVSPSAEFVAGDWQDLALGFVDLQVALRVYDPNGLIDHDSDGDPKRNWYSSDNMESPTLLTADRQLLQARISLVARTVSDIEGVASARTPELIAAGKPLAHNGIGDRPAIVVPVADTTSRYHGNHLYRYTSSLVEFRNLGIGL